MLQMLLPIFPSETTLINANVAVQQKDGTVYYFNATMPIFIHAVEDTNSFRMFTSQLYINGNCTQAEIVRTFGVSKTTVKRDVKQYREKGPGSFFYQSAFREKASCLNPGGH